MIMQEYKKSLVDFCTNYRGPKLCISTRNVGHSLSQIIHTQGGNRVLHSLHIYHSEDSFKKEVQDLQTFKHEDVCKEVAAMLSISSTMKYGAEYKHIGLVGKLSTSRWDREDSIAYISIDEAFYKLKLPVLNIDDYIIVQRDDNIPLIEDYAISQTMLSIITRGIESMPELGDGFLKKINLIEEEN